MLRPWCVSVARLLSVGRWLFSSYPPLIFSLSLIHRERRSPCSYIGASAFSDHAISYAYTHNTPGSQNRTITRVVHVTWALEPASVHMDCFLKHLSRITTIMQRKMPTKSQRACPLGAAALHEPSVFSVLSCITLQHPRITLQRPCRGSLR